ncbi:MAG: biotin--[Oscillospiraceae bacterium]|nr:biotin--[acetyl-CoA-carboxylase] ligase [Oscillospiraceae bacterium]
MSGEKVYRALQAREGEFLSGQELSRSLGITRAAVWKAVEQLRRRGVQVEARTGCGYRLLSGGALTAEAVASYLASPRAHWQVLPAVDSTNNVCRDLARQGAPDGTVVIADCQTAGRGRKGRSFLSPAGMGLYLSILWRPLCQAEELLPLTALAAVAVCRAVERLGGESPRIKWPNDIIMNGKKVCGILTEMTLEGESGTVDTAVVGIGVNCRQRTQDFPPELREIAASLDMTMPRAVERAALAAALMEELDTLRREILFAPERWLEEYRRRCLQLWQPVEILRDGRTLQADVLAVDERFGLTVRYADGTVETLRSGEISVRGVCGYV